MRPQWRQRYRPPQRPENYNPRFTDYEREKQTWIAHHPDATGQEYVEAMREIAQRCGI